MELMRYILCVFFGVLFIATMIGIGTWVYYLGPRELIFTDDEIISWPNYTMPLWNETNGIMPHPEWASQLMNNNYSFVVMDTHSHTTESDGYLTPYQLSVYLSHLGYNCYAQTDHNRNQHELVSNILRIRGYEWSTRRLHLVMLGVDYDNSILGESFSPSDEEIIEEIDNVHQQNGIVIAVHLMYIYPNMPSHESLIKWGVDYIEVINNYSIDPLAYQLYYNQSVGGVCGTDTHLPAGTTCWNIVLINETNPTEGNILDAFRQHRVIINYHPGVVKGPDGGGSPNNDYLLLLTFSVIGNLVSSSPLGVFWAIFNLLVMEIVVILVYQLTIYPPNRCENFCLKHCYKCRY